MFETKAIEVAVGQITGYIKPSEAERKAAYELFVELSTRTATVSVDDEPPSVRLTLDDLGEISQLTRDILRSNGADSAKGRADGNVTLAVVALRVVNEIIGPVLSLWVPKLEQHDANRPDETTQRAWEDEWDDRDVCLHSLASMRIAVRSYMDTLARIAGAPSLSDLVEPPPASVPIPPAMLTTAPNIPDGAVARKAMVRWFDVVEGFRTMLAKRGCDKDREAVRPKRTTGGTAHEPYVPEPPIHIDQLATSETDGGDLWFDYVSDLGDGIDPTIAIAWQLTQTNLTLPSDRSGLYPAPPPELPQGRLLVMGGDQVYPHASGERYLNQLVLPYQVAASANSDDRSNATKPLLFAIPGNHDWYGGSKHFEDIFIHEDAFADNWDTSAQTQRWWAVKLSKDWWMWGLDTGLDNTLDADQVKYFEQAAKELSEGNQVIICTPVPMWQLRQKHQDGYFELRAFLQKTINGEGASTPLFLAGDSHFFAHYRRVDGVAEEHHITSGGGGAFLQPTHNLAEQVPLESGAPDFKLGGRWPRPVDSRALGAKLGGLKGRQFLILFVLVGAVFAGYAGLITVSWRIGDSDPIEGAVDALRWVLSGYFGWPLLVLLVLGAILATVPNSKEPGLQKGVRRYGAMHGAIQVTGFVVVAAVARWIKPETHLLWHYVVTPPVAGALATALMMTVVGWTNKRIRVNDTLAYSSAHVTRYKHFIRMRVTTQGDLSVYVVGLDPVGEKWWEAITGTKAGAASTKPGRKRRADAHDDEQSWQRDLLLPPFDPSGVPQIHYVWGKTFAAGSKEELLERARDLGPDHPDTILSRSNRARKLLEQDDTDERHTRTAIDYLEENLASCGRTYSAEHPTTLSTRCALAGALIGHFDPNLPVGTDEQQNDGLLEQAIGHLEPIVCGPPQLKFAQSSDTSWKWNDERDSPVINEVSLLIEVVADGERTERNVVGLVVEEEGFPRLTSHGSGETQLDAKLSEQARALSLYLRALTAGASDEARFEAVESLTYMGRGKRDDVEVVTASPTMLFEFGNLCARTGRLVVANWCLRRAIEEFGANTSRSLQARMVMLFANIEHETDDSAFENPDLFLPRKRELEALLADCEAAEAVDVAIDVRFVLVFLMLENSKAQYVGPASSELLRSNIAAIEVTRPGCVDRRTVSSFAQLAETTDDDDVRRSASEQVVVALASALGAGHRETLQARLFWTHLMSHHPSRQIELLRTLRDDCVGADEPDKELVSNVRRALAEALVRQPMTKHREEITELVDSVWADADSDEPRSWAIWLAETYELKDQLKRLLEAAYLRVPYGPDQFVAVHQAALGHRDPNEINEEFQEFLAGTSLNFQGTAYQQGEVDRARGRFARALMRLDELEQANAVLEVAPESTADDESDDDEAFDPELERAREEWRFVRRCLDLDAQLAEQPDNVETKEEWSAVLDDLTAWAHVGERRDLIERERFAETLAVLGDLNGALRQHEEVLRHLEDDSTTTDGLLFSVLWEVARLSLKCEDFERSIEMYRRALSIPDEETDRYFYKKLDNRTLYADLADLQHDVAISYLGAERLDEAEAACEIAASMAARTYSTFDENRQAFVQVRGQIQAARAAAGRSAGGEAALMDRS